MSGQVVHGVCRRGHALELHVEQETRTGVVDTACPMCGAQVTAHVRPRIHVPPSKEEIALSDKERDDEHARNRARWKALGL